MERHIVETDRRCNECRLQFAAKGSYMVRKNEVQRFWREVITHASSPDGPGNLVSMYIYFYIHKYTGAPTRKTLHGVIILVQLFNYFHKKHKTSLIYLFFYMLSPGREL